jgi:hypothetical protein
MNAFQKIISAIYPPYKFKIIRLEQKKIFESIISALPNDFLGLKEQTLSANFYGFENWSLHPDFKYVTMGYGEEYFRIKKRGESYKIEGLQIFSKRNARFEKIELLIWDNILWAIKIENSNYEFEEFDLTKINSATMIKSDFFFPKNETDEFYDALENEIKGMLNPDDLLEIELNNRTYYSFFDLEDGNCLAIDKKLKVYSLVHDARPMVKGMKITFIEILNEIKNDKFDRIKHLDERYKSSK